MKMTRIIPVLCILVLGMQTFAEISMTATPAKTGNVVSSVSLSFSGIPANAEYALYVAYGAKDAGGDVRSWEKYEKVADVTSETASYSYAEMPEGWGFKYHAIRFFLFDKNAEMPFDRALEYVEATGTQYVQTDFTPTGASVIEMDIETPNNNQSWEALFSARASNGANAFALFKQNGLLRVDYFSTDGLRATHSADRTRIRCSSEGLFVDGQFQDGPVAAESTACGNPLALFALHKSGTESGFDYFTASAKLYGLRVWENSSENAALVFDLLPCVSNDVVGLYDRVSEKFYAPTGGDLVASSSDVFYFIGSSAAQTPVIADVGNLTVSATANANGTFDISFSAPSGDCKLFAAYDDHDCGDNISDWGNTALVGNIAAGATSFTGWTPPEGWGTSSHYMRFFLVDMSKAPCDRQFDFIKSKGAQYIRLDITPDGRSSVVADVTVDTAVNHGVWSARTSGHDFLLIFYGASDRISWDYLQRHDYLGDPVSLGRHVLAMEANAFFYDGVQLMTTNITTTAFGSPFVVFALNSGESFSTYGKFKLHSFKVWRNRSYRTYTGYGKAVWRDLVPCEKNGQAGLYDRVTGVFYGNSGTGSFDVGSEVACADGLQIGSSGFCFAATGRAMTAVRSYTDDKLSSVRLDFAAAQSSLTNHLYAAFDEMDKGEDIDNWADVRYLDPIAATDSSYTYTFPAWWGRTSQTVRFFLMADAPATTPLPYDKRLEFIKGAGAAYIQTSFYPTGKTRVLMDCEPTGTDNNTIFSVRNPNSFLAIFQGDTRIRYDLYRSSTKYTVTHELNNRYQLVFDGSGAYVDGVKEIPAVVEWPDYDWQSEGVTLSIFALQSNGAVGNGAKGRYKLYSFKAWRDVINNPDVMGLDLVPCMKDGRPGVYDRVSGEFLTSAVSDNFVAGREIPLSPTPVGVTGAFRCLKKGTVFILK